MKWINIVKENFIGALVGAAVVYFFPQLLRVGIYIIAVPSGILGAINLILSVLLGAIVGGLIQSIFNRRK